MTQLMRIDTNAFNKALIGFDRIFNDFENRWQHSASNYPPYNICKTENDTFLIEIAIAGFNKEDITIQVDQDQLSIIGKKKEEETDSKQYLHRGLATRDFERVFTLEAHMIVGEATCKDGILTIQVNRQIPESLKPRIININ